MKTILVPVDYSPSSQTALLYALHMAQKAKLQVVVFHAFYPVVSPPAAYDIPSFIPELEKEKTTELEEYVKDTLDTVPEDVTLCYSLKKGEGEPDLQAAGYGKMTYHTVAIEKQPLRKKPAHVKCFAKMGTVYEQILLVAKAYQADLIVMGMQGGGAIGQTLVGSTTLSVMRHSGVPVLGVPAGARFNGLKTVVLAADLSQQPDKLQLQKLRDFLRAFRSRLQVLHISKGAEKAQVKRALHVLDEQLHDVNYEVILQQRADVASGIREYLQEQRVSLLVLSPQKHNLLERLLDRSITAKMAANGFLPLLTLPTSPADTKTKQAEALQHGQHP